MNVSGDKKVLFVSLASRSEDNFFVDFLMVMEIVEYFFCDVSKRICPGEEVAGLN